MKRYVVIAKTLNDMPYPNNGGSRRGEYATRAEAKAHVERWGENGDKAIIIVEDGKPSQYPLE